MRAIRAGFTALAVIRALPSLPASANDFTRTDVWALVNRDAHNWLVDADNFRLDIETLRIPRSDKDVGKACGEIVPRSSRRSVDAKGSYSSMIVIEEGVLVFAGWSTFFMTVSDLIAADRCR